MLFVIALVFVALPGLVCSYPAQNYPIWLKQRGVGDDSYPMRSPSLFGGYVCCNQPPTPPVPARRRPRGLRSMALTLAKRGAGLEGIPNEVFYAYLQRQLQLGDRPGASEFVNGDDLPNYSDDSYQYSNLLAALAAKQYTDLLPGKRGFVEAASGPGGGNTLWPY